MFVNGKHVMDHYVTARINKRSIMKTVISNTNDKQLIIIS